MGCRWKTFCCCYCFVNFLPALLPFLQHVFWPGVINEVYRLWLFIFLSGASSGVKWWVSGQRLLTALSCVLQIFVHVALNCAGLLRWSHLVFQGVCQLSSRPELSWEVSLPYKVLSRGLHFFFRCGSNLPHVNQESCLQCRNILAVVWALGIAAVYQARVC